MEEMITPAQIFTANMVRNAPSNFAKLTCQCLGIRDQEFARVPEKWRAISYEKYRRLRCLTPACTENRMRVDGVMESPKLAE
jgi:hypothetical protein